MKRVATLGLVLLTASATASAAAHGRHPRTSRGAARSYFLAGDPHVPLAVVEGASIGDRAFSNTRCGGRARWKKLGSHWKALDAWGQPIATVTATSKDDYDVTGCAELSFTPALADDLSHVLVSADSAWRPSPSVAWVPATAARVALDAIAKSTIDDSTVPKDYVWSQCKEIAERTRFFHVAGRGDWAFTTSNAGWLVARAGANGWDVRSFDRPKTTDQNEGRCFRPVAVFDMNGDGVAEIVLRFSGGDGGQDMVMQLGGDDQWRVVATSNGGSTA